MLANYFKTPADLQITDVEHNALVNVLGMLEREELAFGKRYEDTDQIMPTSIKTFHMNITYSKSRCGTVACIGGWAAILMGRDPIDYVQGRGSWPLPEELRKLFWPGDSGSLATRSQAAIALRSYLTIGEANWDDALAERFI